MSMSNTSLEHLFKIDFEKWTLLKDAETGQLKEPVSIGDFDRFEYWDDKNHQPVRQIIQKDGYSHYADYLNLKTGKLERRVSSLLGVSSYDDEIDQEEYEELCQVALLEYHYNLLINYKALLPYHRMALSYLKTQDSVLIQKTKSLYAVDYSEKRLIKTSKGKELVKSSVEIGEYEFYHFVIQKLLKIHGNFLVDLNGEI